MINKNVFYLFLFSAIIRILMIVYGYWQDSVMTVKFTDIDYKVFTDAAKFMTQGKSPYNRSTYRYSPVIAGLLQMNISIHDSIGKIVFCLCDLFIASIWWFILKDHHIHLKASKKLTEDYNFTKLINKSSISDEQNVEKIDKYLIFSLSLWLLNPLILTVSSRGNAEAFILLFVVLFLYFLHFADEQFYIEASHSKLALQSDENLCNTNIKNVTQSAMLGYLSLMISGILFAISIHLKIYPITYSFIIFLNLNCTNKSKKERDSPFELLFPSKRCLTFAISSIFTLLILTILFYQKYGMVFLQESYLHHITRKDHRHNFSPYFYFIYLSSIHPSSLFLSLISFLPQAVLCVVVAFKYYRDVEFACFVQTFVFVAFNKVCTSQYFLWFLLFLPCLVIRLNMSLKKASSLFILWLLGQGMWLFFAYLLEMQGLNTFLYIWIAGLVFLFINTYIISSICSRYRIQNYIGQIQISNVQEIKKTN